MNSIICLIAAVCAISAESIRAGSVAEIRTEKKLYPENELGPFETHEAIYTKLGARLLGPEQVAYLVSSYGGNKQLPLVAGRDASYFSSMNRISKEMCTVDALTKRNKKCKILAQFHEDSALFANLGRFCLAANEKVARYCVTVNEKVLEYCKKRMEAGKNGRK